MLRVLLLGADLEPSAKTPGRTVTPRTIVTIDAGTSALGYHHGVRARDYQRMGSGLRPWPVLMEQLLLSPPAPRRSDLEQRITALIRTELGRDPEREDVLGESRIFDCIERLLQEALPWYGGVLSVTNTALTGISPGFFLVDGEGDARIARSVESILAAVDRLPSFLTALKEHFAEIRAARWAGAISIGGVEGVLDTVIETTACRSGWPDTLLAALQWMHEDCRIPLPELRRAAMADWLAQSCLSGSAPDAMVRAEILTAMTRSMSRPVR